MGIKMIRILIAEDEEPIANLLQKNLSRAGYDCIWAPDGQKAADMMEREGIDLVLLDVMLPGINGYELMEYARELMIPVIFLTALGTTKDKVKGLKMGADDYLTKPFAFEELMARIRCVTRRSPILTPSDPSKVCLEDLTLFIEEKRLMGPAGQCTLSQREAVLTEVLLRAGLNTPMPRTTLLLKVWGPDNDIEDGNLDNYIHFLRRRFRQLESTLQIKTLRGTGYCLTTADERN